MAHMIDGDRYFDVIVRLRVKVSGDAGAAAVHPPGLEIEIGRLDVYDGAGDDQSTVADQTDLLLVEKLAVAEIDKPKKKGK